MKLVIDFETRDPFLGSDRKMGHGWVYAVNEGNNEFKIIGASVKELNSGKDAEFLTDFKEILDRANKADTLVMHNAQYDLGCLMYVEYCLTGKVSFEGVFEKDIIDTAVMSFLDNSSRKKHSLESLSQELFNESKNINVLCDAAYEADLMRWTAKELTEKKRAFSKGLPYSRKRPEDKDLAKLAIKNLDRLPLDVVAKYCNQDVILTHKLYNSFYPKKEERILQYFFSSIFFNIDRSLLILLILSVYPITFLLLVEFYSNISKICLKNRLSGVPVNKDKLIESIPLMKDLIKQKENELFSLTGEFNIKSSKQTVSVLTREGLKCPLTKKGNPSATSKWLKKQTHPVCKLLVETRKAHKLLHDFFEGVLKKLEYSPSSRVYPELRVLGARTSRFSCVGPNIQQIPSDRTFGKLCRGIYSIEDKSDLLSDGYLFHSLDYANQEGRLQLHYAYLLGCRGSEKAVEEAQNPDWDMHLNIARLIWGDSITKDSQERKAAKEINFGLSYGMGVKKLAEEILGISYDTALRLVKEYFKAAPYLEELISFCKGTVKLTGKIKILGGALLTADKSEDKDFSYKATNMLIQGSASYQTSLAMNQAHNEGIPMLFPVHDEIDTISKMATALRLKHIMETCVKLVVPSIVNHSYGLSWGECK